MTSVGWKALWLPNLICYVRVALLLPVLIYHEKGLYIEALSVYLVSTALDFVDGILARQLRLTSRFGALLDVVVDKYV